MKRFRTVFLLAAMAISLNSCDFVRSMMGKPTSAELEQMRIEAEKKAARERFVADSIKAAEEARKLAEAEAANAGQMEKVSDNDPRYNVIFGCFKVEENAVNFRAFLEKNGLSPKRLVFRSGYDVVCVYQTDDLPEAYRMMRNMMDSEYYCPEDVWIYDLNQGLHE